MDRPPEAAMSSPPIDAMPAKAFILRYLVFFTLVWISLTEGAVHSWILGIVVVPLATWMSVVVLNRDTIPPSPAMNFTGFVKFLPFFFWQSLRGGWESAQFAIQPRKQLHLGFLKYSTSLPCGRPRLYFLHVISLLPGTVSAAIDGEHILVHALDMSADHSADLRECEQRVAAVFGLDIGPWRMEETVALEGDSE